jgi:hypothetical protein
MFHTAGGLTLAVLLLQVCNYELLSEVQSVADELVASGRPIRCEAMRYSIWQRFGIKGALMTAMMRLRGRVVAELLSRPTCMVA